MTNQKPFKSKIGGQALLEGILMIGPQQSAISVRTPEGEIVTEIMEQTDPSRVEKIPVIRGSYKLVRQMILGTKALMRSAELSGADQDSETNLLNPSQKPPASNVETEQVVEGPPEDESISSDEKENDQAVSGEPVCCEAADQNKTAAEKESTPFWMVGVLLFALALAILLFGLLPNAVTELIRHVTGLPRNPSMGLQIVLNLIEGFVRILVLIGYLAFTKMNRDMARVWQYHGAEHKTIYCYESGEDLTVENAKKFSRFHPRCGTSFLFLVMLVAVLLLSFTGWHGTLLNVLIRIVMLPLIAGVSYEVLRWTGLHDGRCSMLLRKPGLWMQRLTTAEPDDSMLEVAITAMKTVAPQDRSDRWGD